MSGDDIFLGRQPILDRGQRVVAYELLFRTANRASVTVSDDMQATASVIQHAFSEMGVQAVLGAHRGFINVSADMLLSDRVELLPSRRSCWNCSRPSGSPRRSSSVAACSSSSFRIGLLQPE